MLEEFLGIIAQIEHTPFRVEAIPPLTLIKSSSGYAWRGHLQPTMILGTEQKAKSSLALLSVFIEALETYIRYNNTDIRVSQRVIVLALG